MPIRGAAERNRDIIHERSKSVNFFTLIVSQQAEILDVSARRYLLLCRFDN